MILNANIVSKSFRYDIEYRYRYLKLSYSIDRFLYFYWNLIDRNDKNIENCRNWSLGVPKSIENFRYFYQNVLNFPKKIDKILYFYRKFSIVLYKSSARSILVGRFIEILCMINMSSPFVVKEVRPIGLKTSE